VKNVWRLWAKALGEKQGKDHEADCIAFIRTVIILQAVVCNFFIVANIIKNW
jgi:hypothetical protein|tara:strand:- start:325 stop:480 length:156 start_codon:yes stop_codon:yes gene_type:complete